MPVTRPKPPPHIDPVTGRTKYNLSLRNTPDGIPGSVPAISSDGIPTGPLPKTTPTSAPKQPAAPVTPAGTTANTGTPAPGDTRTYKQIGESLIQDEYNRDVATGKKFGVETYGSITEQYEDTIRSFKEDKAIQEMQLKNQKEGNIDATTTSKNILEAGQETQEGMLSDDREGFTSESNTAAKVRLKEATTKQINRIIADQNTANAAIENAKANLARAQKGQNQSAIRQYQQELDAAESKAKQIETDYITAVTAQVDAETRDKLAENTIYQTKAAVTNSGINTFKGLIDSGVEMNYSTVKGYADALGLPADMLMGYYDGAAIIRDDKTLDAETKAVKLAQLGQDLQDQITGMDTQAAKNAKALTNLRAMGASAETISAFKEAAGITDYDDPLTKLKFSSEDLKLRVAKAQAQGKPVTSSEINERAKLLSELSLMGQTLDANGNVVDVASGSGVNNVTAYVPTGPIQGFTATFENGQLVCTTPVDPKTGKPIPTQCGVGVNRVWGLPSGGSEGMGNTYESKQKLVDKNGLKSNEITDPDNQIVPGMAFVMGLPGTKYEWTGHTGLVKQNLGNGNFLTAEWNWDGKGGYSEQVRNLNQIYGLAYPPAGKANVQSSSPDSVSNMSDAEILKAYEQSGKVFYDVADQKKAITAARKTNFVPGLGSVSSDPQVIAVNDGLSALATNASSKFSYDAIKGSINNYLEKGETQKAKNLILTAAGNSLDATASQDFKGSKLTMDLLDGIQSDLQVLQDRGVGTGWLKGKEEDVANFIGKTTDPEVAKLQSKIFSAIQRYRKSITGAGFAESETSEYNKIFPGIGKSQELNTANIDALREVLEANVDGYYSQVLGEDVYNSLVGKQAEQQKTEWDTIDLETPEDILAAW